MQAILITAYKDKNQLIRLLKWCEDSFAVYIHLDKKADISVDEITDMGFKNVFVYKYIKVTWGGYNHLEAVLYLMREAAKNSAVSYVHIISGQDYPIKSIEDFKRYFEYNDKIYMTCTSRKDFNDCIMRRLENYILSSNLDTRNKKVSDFNDFVSKWVKRIAGSRKSIGEYHDIYKGMIWASMPIYVINYVLNYVDLHPRFLNELKHVAIPEEFFLQTIIMNSRYRVNVVPKNLRYTDWTVRYGVEPAILDESDFKNILDSSDFFARKIDSTISKKLIILINEVIHETTLRGGSASN